MSSGFSIMEYRLDSIQLNGKKTSQWLNWARIFSLTCVFPTLKKPKYFALVDLLWQEGNGQESSRCPLKMFMQDLVG